MKKDGTSVNVNIGEKDTDPVFCVTDLLIHLASKQMDKKAATVVEGENLDILVGSIPVNENEKKSVKADVYKRQIEPFFKSLWLRMVLTIESVP